MIKYCTRWHVQIRDYEVSTIARNLSSCKKSIESRAPLVIVIADVKFRVGVLRGRSGGVRGRGGSMEERLLDFR